MIIKCKMCGGDVHFNQGDTVGQCDYCESLSTIPKVDEEQKLNRYNRANHFRRQCDFDKAIAAYERILEEDETDAEAHWGAVISRYGIEYVEDPATHRRVPTCHRVQLESILTDADYLAAVENAADEKSRKLYEEQAKEIADIQKNILMISSNEKPYDIFICYKETDENGQRTRDSALAQEVYYGLTENGYKVFFSRITLEDKLGQQYEPYIFAALNSARVMVVIGTKPEYFNAVWVKNEWSRYLRLMKNDRKRLLIPCYRDMDPYDLPDELSNLQSQDMGKIGFIQDLIRGIEKVTQKKEEENSKTNYPLQSGSMEPHEHALFDRALFAIEDGEFQKADEFIEQALNINARNPQAYLIKLMIERKVQNEEDLGNQSIPLEQSGNYAKIMRFADDETKAKLQQWSEKTIQNAEYAKVSNAFKNATSVSACQNLIQLLEKNEVFKDKEQFIAACKDRITQLLLQEKERQEEQERKNRLHMEQARQEERQRKEKILEKLKNDRARYESEMGKIKGFFSSDKKAWYMEEIEKVDSRIKDIEKQLDQI